MQGRQYFHARTPRWSEEGGEREEVRLGARRPQGWMWSSRGDGDREASFRAGGWSGVRGGGRREALK